MNEIPIPKEPAPVVPVDHGSGSELSHSDFEAEDNFAADAPRMSRKEKFAKSMNSMLSHLNSARMTLCFR